MSELPVASDAHYEVTQENAPQYHYTSSEFARDIHVLERGPAPESQIDLHDDGQLDPEYLNHTVETTAAPSYELPSREEMLSSIYESLTVPQTIADISAVSNGVIALRELQQRGNY